MDTEFYLELVRQSIISNRLQSVDNTNCSYWAWILAHNFSNWITNTFDLEMLPNPKNNKKTSTASEHLLLNGARGGHSVTQL